MYHGTVYQNKQLKTLLSEFLKGELDRFVLASIRGKPARTKNVVRQRGDQIIVFGSDFIAKGYLKHN